MVARNIQKNRTKSTLLSERWILSALTDYSCFSFISLKLVNVCLCYQVKACGFECSFCRSILLYP